MFRRQATFTLKLWISFLDFHPVLTTMTTTTTTLLQTQADDRPRLAIKKEHLAGLDPEWVELWHTHGAHMVRADELSLEEYRKDPSLYSFTYPTCEGEFFTYPPT